MRVNSSRSERAFLELADDLLDVAARAEAAAAAGDHEAAASSRRGSSPNEVAQIGVDVERKRVELVRAVKVTSATPPSTLKSKCSQRVGERGGARERAHAWMPPPSMTSVWPLIAAASAMPGTQRRRPPPPARAGGRAARSASAATRLLRVRPVVARCARRNGASSRSTKAGQMALAVTPRARELARHRTHESERRML